MLGFIRVLLGIKMGVCSGFPRVSFGLLIFGVYSGSFRDQDGFCSGFPWVSFGLMILGIYSGSFRDQVGRLFGLSLGFIRVNNFGDLFGFF